MYLNDKDKELIKEEIFVYRDGTRNVIPFVIFKPSQSEKKERQTQLNCFIEVRDMKDKKYFSMSECNIIYNSLLTIGRLYVNFLSKIYAAENK